MARGVRRGGLVRVHRLGLEDEGVTSFPEAPVPAPDPLGIGGIALFAFVAGFVAGAIWSVHTL